MIHPNMLNRLRLKVGQVGSGVMNSYVFQNKQAIYNNLATLFGVLSGIVFVYETRENVKSLRLSNRLLTEKLANKREFKLREYSEAVSFQSRVLKKNCDGAPEFSESVLLYLMNLPGMNGTCKSASYGPFIEEFLRDNNKNFSSLGNLIRRYGFEVNELNEDREWYRALRLLSVIIKLVVEIRNGHKPDEKCSVESVTKVLSEESKKQLLRLFNGFDKKSDVEPSTYLEGMIRERLSKDDNIWKTKILRKSELVDLSITLARELWPELNKSLRESDTMTQTKVIDKMKRNSKDTLL